MRDTVLYPHLLGLEAPWTVEKVELDVKSQRVDVWVGHPRRHRWPCPECGTACSLYDHAPERMWRHLDSCQFQTFLHARPPRVKCPEHGVRQVDLPWAEPKGRFTLLFESFAIRVLEQTTIEGACQILGISWDEAWHVLRRAVERGLARKSPRLIRYLGVDEKAAGRGQSNYITVACDAEAGVVDDVMMGRSKASFEDYLKGLTPEQREAIEAVAMDMHEAYIQAVKAQFPDRWDEMIVFDRFHIMQHMTNAVDQVRRAEHRRLVARDGQSPLTGTRFMWLYGRERVPRRYWSTYYALRDSDLKTARAWAIKENLRRVWHYKLERWAMPYYRRWYYWATHSRLEPVKRVAKMIHSRLYGVRNYFRHRITNAMTEGLNSRLDAIWRKARGYRNKARYRLVILFHLGDLPMDPVTH